MAAPVLAFDLYLREQWDALAAAEPDHDQRRLALGRRYIALGAAGRWPYHQAAQQAADAPASVTPAEGSRSDQERRWAHLVAVNRLRAWIRTSYATPSFLDGLNQEAIPRATGQEDVMAAPLALIDDRQLYEGMPWQSILHRIPEIVESHTGERDPAILADRKREFFEDMLPQLYDIENEPIDDIPKDIIDMSHTDFVTGCFWVQDAHADTNKEMLVVWVDHYGRVIRENRVKDVTQWGQMLRYLYLGDCPWWQSASVGEDYNPLPEEELQALRRS